MARQVPTPRRVLPTSPFLRPEVPVPSTSAFSVGDRVTYDRCGMGRVIAVDADFVTVDFGEGDIRQFAAGTAGIYPV